MQYKRKSGIVEAVKWNGQNKDDIINFCGNSADWQFAEDIIIIRSLGELTTVRPGDYVIKGRHGDYYPCMDVVFEEAYEEI